MCKLVSIALAVVYFLNDFLARNLRDEAEIISSEGSKTSTVFGEGVVFSDVVCEFDQFLPTFISRLAVKSKHTHKVTGKS